MSANSLVSVIIPAFNAQDYIAETLDSVLAQSYDPVEVIVVDDGSTDNTARIVKGYGERVRYYYQHNSGGCAVPRNTGIRHCSGELVCFIDADDLMVADRIASQAGFLQRHQHIGLVFCDYRNFTEKGPYPESHFQTCPRLRPQLQSREEIILDNPCALLAQENFGIAGSFLVRRKVLESEAGFEPTLKSCEDFHFYFRLARHTAAGIINRVGMMRRMHGSNMSGNIVRMRSEGIRSRALLLATEADPEVRAYLSRYIVHCKSDLARFHADQGRYFQSLQYNWQVLSGPFFWPESGRACRNTLRTIMMAAGLHRPKEN